MKKLSCIFLILLMLTIFPAGCRSSVTEPDESELEPSISEADPVEEEPEKGPIRDQPWETGAPENYGVNAEPLSALHSALQGTDIHSVITIKDGTLIDEFYQDGYDETSVFRLASCSKSFTGALIGIAIDKGLIDGGDVS